MNEQEKAALKEEILTELEERFKGIAIREDVQGILSDVRNKWFRDRRSNDGKCLMFEAFGPYTYWKVWELIRKLTCLICGCGYVRHLSNKSEANEIAERLCKTIYDLRKEYMERGGAT